MAYNTAMIFIETPIFTKRIQKAMDDDTYAALQQELVKRPDAGDVIQGSGGIRKVRWGGSGRGKRGGSRMLYFWNCAGRILYALCLPEERAGRHNGIAAKAIETGN